MKPNQAGSGPKPIQRLFSLLWAGLLLGFTLFAALDTFVIEHTYAVAEAPQSTPASAAESTGLTAIEVTPLSSSEEPANTEAPAAAEPTEEAAAEAAPTLISTDSRYADGNVSITLKEIRAYDSTVYVADVVLSSPEYLQTAFANSVYGRNVTAKTSSIARNANAILAVNGDYYGARQSGYVIRNGVLYRDKANKSAEDLVIYQDGTFGIINESQITAQALLDSGAWNVLSFGPALLIDGEIAVDSKDEVGRAKASNPRTAIGIVDDLHYLFVVSDGRTSSSEGLSLKELAINGKWFFAPKHWLADKIPGENYLTQEQADTFTRRWGSSRCFFSTMCPSSMMFTVMPGSI